MTGTNGKCVVTLPDSVTCECHPGFSGQRCESRDPCEPNPCQNGKCVPGYSGSGYQCTCPAGFKGKLLCFCGKIKFHINSKNINSKNGKFFFLLDLVLDLLESKWLYEYKIR